MRLAVIGSYFSSSLLPGSKSRNTIRDQYYRDPKVKENKLPVLYTATSTVGDTRGEFLIVQKAIEERPDSLKYVEWEDGDAPPLADIYLVEKIMGGDPFILATILGSSIESDVVRALPRTEYKSIGRDRTAD